MREYTQQEWDALIKAYPPGTSVSGTVVSCQIFGVFVQLDVLPEVKALLEVIHFGLLVDDPEHKIIFPQDYPSVGTRIIAKVLGWCLKPVDVRLTQLQHIDWIHSEWVAKQK
jgi:ribosomal protein S1